MPNKNSIPKKDTYTALKLKYVKIIIDKYLGIKQHIMTIIHFLKVTY